MHVFPPCVSAVSGSTGRVGISKKRSVFKAMLLKISTVFPETLVHINIYAGPARSMSVRMQQEFGGYVGEPSQPHDPLVPAVPPLPLSRKCPKMGHANLFFVLLDVL